MWEERKLSDYPDLFERQKDWTGNAKSTFVTLGASNHTEKERQNEDYYATDPVAAELLLQAENFSPRIWECACGEKHLAKVFEKHGYEVRASDIVDRCGNEVYDFLAMDNTEWDGDIITNPPYRYALEFIYKALEIIPEGRKVAMFLKVQFLEGKERKTLFTTAPPAWFMSAPHASSAPKTRSSERCGRAVEVPLPTPGMCGRKATRVTR